MAKTVKVKDVTLEWAKHLTEEGRDMGPEDDSDLGIKLKETQGQYVVDIMINDEQKKQMVADGVPDKGLQAQLFKTRDTGEMFYKCRRPHFNPKFTDRATGEKGVVMGPPDIYMNERDDEGKLVRWNPEEHGLIGNGTTADVRFDVWNNSITRLDAILITDLVAYESDGSNEGEF